VADNLNFQYNSDEEQNVTIFLKQSFDEQKLTAANGKS
jgi:hypothetical protein